MAFMTVKLVPGVHAEQTPLLLQAGVIQSNNVRWRDGLPEKTGGWVKFFYEVPGQLNVATVTATAAFTTHYNGIAVPPNPGGAVEAGMQVLDTTTGLPLGTVASYGPLNVSQDIGAAFSAGDTTIDMTPYLAANSGIIPGMDIVDAFLGEDLGTVLTYIGSTLTLAAPAPFNSETVTDTLTFSSGTDDVLVTVAPLQAASAGDSDTILFTEPGPPTSITPPPLAGPIRELWPWADFNANLRLAAGGDQGLFVVSLDQPDITPRYILNSVSTYLFTTTAGSTTVTVENVDPHLTQNAAGALVFDNYVAVGGLILYGAYAILPVTTTAVEIQAATAATTTVIESLGTVSTFSVTADSQICTVILPGST